MPRSGVPVCARGLTSVLLHQPGRCGWQVLLQSCELPNHQPHQGKEPDGAPCTVPRKIGRPRSCVEGPSAEIGPPGGASTGSTSAAHTGAAELDRCAAPASKLWDAVAMDSLGSCGAVGRRPRVPGWPNRRRGPGSSLSGATIFCDLCEDRRSAYGVHALRPPRCQRPAELEGVAVTGEPDRGAVAKLSGGTKLSLRDLVGMFHAPNLNDIERRALNSLADHPDRMRRCCWLRDSTSDSWPCRWSTGSRRCNAGRPVSAVEKGR
jgi:hypothetical protein